MTSEEIRSFIGRYVKAWEEQDLPTLVECFTDNARVQSPMFRTIEGRTKIESSFRDLFKAFDDWDIKLDDIIIDRGPEDRAVFLVSAHLTHRGDIFGMPGTGRRIETSGAFILSFENGRIASERRVYDFTGFLVQLGVLKAKAV